MLERVDERVPPVNGAPAPGRSWDLVCATWLVVIVAILTAVACHVTPLPVPNRGDWSPEHGATDYPELARAPHDAGLE